MATYSEKLRDPRWQKKRLETLEAAGWQCQYCGTKTNTLNVHHKRYFKGKDPWEYDATYLGVLCETCHTNHHRLEERIKEILCLVPLEFVFPILAGFFENAYGIDPGLQEEAKQEEPLMFAVGFTAGLIGGDIESIRKVAEFAVSMTPETSEVRQLFIHNQDVFGK